MEFQGDGEWNVVAAPFYQQVVFVFGTGKLGGHHRVEDESSCLSGLGRNGDNGEIDGLAREGRPVALAPAAATLAVTYCICAGETKTPRGQGRGVQSSFVLRARAGGDDALALSLTATK